MSMLDCCSIVLPFYPTLKKRAYLSVNTIHIGKPKWVLEPVVGITSCAGICSFPFPLSQIYGRPHAPRPSDLTRVWAGRLVPFETVRSKAVVQSHRGCA